MAAPEETEMEPVGVHPVTGRVLETEEAKVTGLRQVRRRMAASLASGEVARYPRDDDKFLLAFLRARKYNIEKVGVVRSGAHDSVAASYRCRSAHARTTRVQPVHCRPQPGVSLACRRTWC